MDNNDVVAARRRALQKQSIAVRPLWFRPRARSSCRANRMTLPVREFRFRRVSLLKAGGSNDGILLVSE